MTILLSLLAGLFACSPSNQPLSTPTAIPPTSIPEPINTYAPSPPSETPPPTPLTCLTLPGRVEEGLLKTVDRGNGVAVKEQAIAPVKTVKPAVVLFRLNESQMPLPDETAEEYKRRIAS